MPMNGDLLGKELMAAIDALSDEQKKDRAAVFKAMGGAFVKHVHLNAGIVAVTVLPGLATGPGGGPVAGALSLPPGSIK